MKIDLEYIAAGCLLSLAASAPSPLNCPLKYLTFTQTHFHSLFQRTETITNGNGNTSLKILLAGV